MKIISNLVEVHIFRKRKSEIEFLLLKRSPGQIYPNLWQMVSGKIKKGETAEQTVLRELKEETGLHPEKLWIVPKVNSFFETKDDSINIIPVFSVLVTADNVRLSKEHTDFKWVKLKEAQKMLAWPGQREAVKIIHQYFQKEKRFLNFMELKISK